MGDDTTAIELSEKAIQQIVATAVKHSAVSVDVFVREESVKAIFHFEREPDTSVVLASNPDNFVRGLWQRTVLRVTGSGQVRGVFRLEFKALVVDTEISFPQVLAGDDLVLRLERFVVDSPETPAFWQSIPRSTVQGLREILNGTAGVLIVCGKVNSSRNLVLRSIRESYPSVETIPIVSELGEDLGLFERAKERVVAVGVGDADVFSVLESVASFGRRKKEVVKGIFGFQQISRNCPFCLRPSSDVRELLQQLHPGEYARKIDGARGVGCSVCDKKGTLGYSSCASLLMFKGEFGEAFWENEGAEQLLAAHSASEFRSLYEAGLLLASKGLVPSDIVKETLPLPPKYYREYLIRQSLAANGEPEFLEVGEDFLAGERDKEIDDPIARGEVSRSDGVSEVPLQGAAALRGRDIAVENEVTPTPEENVNRGGVGKRIFIICLDPEQRVGLEKTLEFSGFEISSALGGVDAVVSVQQSRPDLVIISDKLEGMSTSEVIRHLKQDVATRQIPILGVSGGPDSEKEYALFLAGVDEVCAKTSAKRVLLKRIERLVVGGS